LGKPVRLLAVIVKGDIDGIILFSWQIYNVFEDEN